MTRFVTFASRALIASSLFAVPIASFAQTGSPATPTASGPATGGTPGAMPDAKAGTPAASVTSPSAVPEKTQTHAGATHGAKTMPKEHVSKDTSHSTAKVAPAPTHTQTPAKTGGAS